MQPNSALLNNYWQQVMIFYRGKHGNPYPCRPATPFPSRRRKSLVFLFTTGNVSQPAGHPNSALQLQLASKFRDPRSVSSGLPECQDPVAVISWEKEPSIALIEKKEQKDTGGVSVDGDGGRPPFGSKPMLVYDHGFGPNNRQTAVSIADMSVHTHVVPELTENNFHVTPHGWVFLNGQGSLSTRLWDPRSGESLALPDMEHDLPLEWRCYLSDVPTAPSCVVLLLYISEPKFLYCRVVGDTHWTTHEYDVGDMNLPPSYAPPSKRAIQQAGAIDGKFYILEMGKLGVLEFSPAPEFSYHDYTPPTPVDGSGCCRSHMAASGGELFDVRIYHKGFTPEILTVRVYKFDDLAGPTATMREVADLGDKVLLLSDSNQLVLKSASKYGLKGNRIYFMHNVLEELDGGLLHVFDLDNQSLDTVRPCHDMTELMSCPFWMLTTDHDIDSPQEVEN